MTLEEQKVIELIEKYTKTEVDMLNKDLENDIIITSGFMTHKSAVLFAIQECQSCYDEASKQANLAKIIRQDFWINVKIKLLIIAQN